jgi:two-component system, NarL family, response regulator NreC
MRALPSAGLGQVRVIILDECALVRDGIRATLSRKREFKILGDAGSLEEALSIPEAHLIVCDSRVGNHAGGTLIGALKAKNPEAEILVLSFDDHSSMVRECFAAGARGYILKEASGSEVLEAILRVAQGEGYLHPRLGAGIASSPVTHSSRDADRLYGNLTPKELDVVRILALGHTNTETAKLLGIAVRTVEAHRSRIMTRLGLTSRADLVKVAMKAGLLNAEGARSSPPVSPSMQPSALSVSDSNRELKTL